jgi:putative endonuclease
MKKHNYFVYIVTNKNRTVVYVGITSRLSKRIMEHFYGLVEGFTKKYNCKYLVFYEHYSDVRLAISREKQIKKWNRKKKNEHINKFNPEWKFLNESLACIESVYEDN